MLDQSIDFKILSQDIFNTESFGYFRQKGIIVEQEQEWSELIIKVATLDCRLSFKKIFDHFYPLLIAKNLKSGLSQETSKELAQETMMKVWRQATSFDPEKGHFELWIYVIARNVRFDYFRKIKNDPLNMSASDIFLENSIDDTKDLDTLFDVSQLSKIIEELPLEQREVINKIYFEGFTQQEVAGIFNIPLGTVKSRVRLALTALKNLKEEN